MSWGEEMDDSIDRRNDSLLVECQRQNVSKSIANISYLKVLTLSIQYYACVIYGSVLCEDDRSEPATVRCILFRRFASTVRSICSVFCHQR
jgi:hypothetical protein